MCLSIPSNFNTLFIKVVLPWSEVPYKIIFILFIFICLSFNISVIYNFNFDLICSSKLFLEIIFCIFSSIISLNLLDIFNSLFSSLIILFIYFSTILFPFNFNSSYILFDKSSLNLFLYSKKIISKSCGYFFINL